MKAWLQGLGAAALGGATTGVTQVVATTGSVNKGTLLVAGVGALATVVAYLLKSPFTTTATK